MRQYAIDRYVLDTLMADLVGHDRHPAAFIVYLALTARSLAEDGLAVTLSLRELAEATGLSKRAVQDAVQRLDRRKLVMVDRASPTAVPEYTVLKPWNRRR
ncbi:MAG: helix-turn-helix domain-containing protein [Gemmatimonadota bacterium]